MRLHGRSFKAIKNLHSQLNSARAVLGMWPALAEGQKGHARVGVFVQVMEASRAVARAGHAEAAHAALDEAAGKPPKVDPPELTWASVIDAARLALVQGASPPTVSLRSKRETGATAKPAASCPPDL
jgi:hypothetical protein